MLIALAIVSNTVPMYFGLKNDLRSVEKMKVFFSQQNISGFSGLIFKDRCMKQYEFYAQSDPNDFIFAEIFITTFTELFFMLLIGILSYLAIASRSNAPIKMTYVIYGFLIAWSLFLVDQSRYYFTSIGDDEKRLFTSSSYCFQGDMALFISTVGYFLMHTALALGIARFISLSMDALRKNPVESIMKIDKSESLYAVCRIYTWLPYFSYIGFAVWIAGTGITGYASKLYLYEAIMITSVLVVVFIACLIILILISSKYNNVLMKKSGKEMSRCNANDNPLDELLGPFGSRAFNVFIRVVTPLLTFAALYYKLFDVFAK